METIQTKAWILKFQNLDKFLLPLLHRLSFSSILQSIAWWLMRGFVDAVRHTHTNGISCILRERETCFLACQYVAGIFCRRKRGQTSANCTMCIVCIHSAHTVCEQMSRVQVCVFVCNRKCCSIEFRFPSLSLSLSRTHTHKGKWSH